MLLSFFFLFFNTLLFHPQPPEQTNKKFKWLGNASQGLTDPAYWPLDGSLSGHQTSVGLQLMGHVGQFLPHHSNAGCVQPLEVDLISKAQRQRRMPVFRCACVS